MGIDGFDLAGWAHTLGYEEFQTSPDDLVCVGDMEVAWYISRRGGVYTADFESKGHRRGVASASDAGGGLRVVMLEMGRGARSARRLPSLEATVPAGVDLEEGPTAFHLRWSDGWIDVHKGFRGDRRARLLAASVQGTPEQLRESLEAPTGAPLFTVGGRGAAHLGREEAREVARSILAELQTRLGDRLAIFDGQFGVEGLRDEGDAWLVNWNSERYLESGEVFDQVLAGPIVIPKDRRPPFLLGTADPVDVQMRRWRSTG